MKKQIFLISLAFVTFINGNAQSWVISKQYKDEWGDKTGKKLIQQKVEGTFGLIEKRILVIISKDVPSIEDFSIEVYDLNGNPFRFLSITPRRVENPPPKRIIRKNPFMNPATYPGTRIIENKYLFKYKIGNKESFFYITKSQGIFLQDKLFFKVNYSKLNSILLSTGEPIKCIIAEEVDEYGTSNVSNLFRFTLYPNNYKQIGR